MCACVRVCACVCVRACVRACVHARSFDCDAYCCELSYERPLEETSLNACVNRVADISHHFFVTGVIEEEMY